MRREVSCEGDRGKATRVANRFDAVAEITDEHFAGAKLRLRMDKYGVWTLDGWDAHAGRMRPIMHGTLTHTDGVTPYGGWSAPIG